MYSINRSWITLNHIKTIEGAQSCLTWYTPFLLLKKYKTIWEIYITLFWLVFKLSYLCFHFKLYQHWFSWWYAIFIVQYIYLSFYEIIFRKTLCCLNVCNYFWLQFLSNIFDLYILCFEVIFVMIFAENLPAIPKSSDVF